jgi:hypothetical protein
MLRKGGENYPPTSATSQGKTKQRETAGIGKSWCEAYILGLKHLARILTGGTLL